MDLFKILFARKQAGGSGGGSGGGDVTAAGGFSILWDGNTEGREYIDLEALIGVNYYKTSDKVLSVADLTKSAVFMIATDGQGGFARMAMDMVAAEILPGVSGLVQANSTNASFAVLSAKVGDYNYNGATVHVPSDGVYFSFGVSIIGTTFIEAIYNHDRNRNDYNF